MTRRSADIPIQYIAKVADFGFSGVDATNDVNLRGLTRHWAAPEAETICGDAASFERGAHADCYSFGLLCVYIGLGGVDILLGSYKETEGPTDEDLLYIKAQEAIDKRYEAVQSGQVNRIAEGLKQITSKTVRKDPRERTWSLRKTRNEL